MAVGLMSRAEKIAEMLQLAGVPGRDYDIAMPNAERLSDAEIDQRLDRLRARERRFVSWRERRGPAVQRPAAPKLQEIRAALDQFLDSNTALEERLKEAIGLATLVAQKEGADLSLRRANAIRSVLHAVREKTSKLLPSARGIESAEVKTIADLEGIISSQAIQAIGSAIETAATLARSVSEDAAELLQHPRLAGEAHRLTWTGTIDAFARVQNVLTKYPPDLIVAANHEGSPVAQLLRHQLNPTIPILHFYGHHDTELRWVWDGSLPQGTRPNIICIVGHLAFSGKTLTHVIEHLRGKYGTEKVFGAVLAATVEATTRVCSTSSVVHHQLSAGTGIQLDFDPVLGIDIKADGYVFKGKNQRQYPISFNSLKLAGEDMAAVYPSAPKPWLPAKPIVEA